MKAFRKLTASAQLLILHLYSYEKPKHIFLWDTTEAAFRTTTKVDVSILCRYLHSSGLTHQRLCQVAIQRDEFTPQQCIPEVSVYKSEILVFLDETGADQRNTLRKYGYNLQGIPLKNNALWVWGEHVNVHASAIAFMSGFYELLDVSIVRGTTDDDIIILQLYAKTPAPTTLPIKSPQCGCHG